MPVFGCHSCGVKLQDYADKPYEQWPCATCALSKYYYHTFSTGYFDTANLEKTMSEVPEDAYMEAEEAALENDADFVIDGEFPLREHEIRTLRQVQQAVTNQLYATFSGLIVHLLRLGSKHPHSLEVVLKKMQFPYMSYTEIGESMNPRCSKQNVLYYLKTAVKELPDLTTVLTTSTRGGRSCHALRTLADKRKQEVSEERIQRILYKDKYDTLRFGMDELNKILQLPFNVDDSILDFRAYGKCDELDGEGEHKETTEDGASEDKTK